MIRKLFLEHPEKVNESYFQHFGVALGFAGALAYAALAALCHALIPALCERTASESIARLHQQLQKRH